MGEGMSQPDPRVGNSGALLHDETLGGAEEGDDLLDFGAVRYLLFDLQDGVVEADLTIEDQAVSHREMALCALVDIRLREHAGMDPSVDGRVVLDGDEGRYVFAEAAAREDESQITDATAGLGRDAAAEDRAATDGAVAGDLDRIAEDILIAYLTVVRDVGAFHKDVPTADDGGDVASGGAADDYVLTDHVVVADDERGLLALVGEVLGRGTEHGILIDGVATTDARAIHQADVRVDGAVVTDDDVVLDVGEGIDRHTGADLGARCDEGLWTDHSDRGLLGASAEGIIEVDDGLHLAEAVAYLGELGLQECLLGGDDLEIRGGLPRLEEGLDDLDILFEALDL